MAAASVGLAVTLGVHAQAVPIVAVLERFQCATDSSLAVRPLFALAGGGWIALDTPGAIAPFERIGMTWSVAFNGRSLGTIRTVDTGFVALDDGSYSRDRRLTIEPTSVTPRVRNSRKQFGGQCRVPANRPLVLVAPPNVSDPDRWTAVSLGASTSVRLFDDFARASGPAMHCPADPDASVPFVFTPADLRVTSAYRDRIGRTLVALRLDPRGNRCDGVPGEEWNAQWFLVTHEVRSLGANLDLLDAGDYDGDGRSELLFWYGGANEDGYTLFAENLRHRADFRWRYH